MTGFRLTRARLNSAAARKQHLEIFLWIMGVFLVAVLPFLVYRWPSGWRWRPYNTRYEHMVIAIYVTVGAFLLFASRNPLRYRSLIWFVVWSSIVHSAVMAHDAITTPQERGHLLGDVPFGFISAIILGILARRGLRERRAAG